MAEDQGTGATRRAEASDAQPAPRRTRRGRVRVFGNWCKGCGLCIAFCPRSVFVAGESGHPLAVYPERCTACMWCTEHCPDFAISVTPFSVDADERREKA